MTAITRRTLFAVAPAGLGAFLPGLAAAAPADPIQHHYNELVRHLNARAPGGTVLSSFFTTAIKGNGRDWGAIAQCAGPRGWKDPYFRMMECDRVWRKIGASGEVLS